MLQRKTEHFQLYFSFHNSTLQEITGSLTALAFPLTVLVFVSALVSVPPSDEAVDKGRLGAAFGSSSISSMDTGAAAALAEADFLVFVGLAGRLALAFSMIAVI